MKTRDNHAKKTAYVFLNPVAGHSNAESVRDALEKNLPPERWALDIYETTGNEDLAEMARAACQRGVELVVAAGGDGTVSGVVNGLVDSGVPLGILPLGTGNALARAMNIPLDLEDALALLVNEHEEVSLDGMRVGEKFYVLNVSAGISARAMRGTPPEQKRRFGMAAYAWTILTQLFGFQPRRFLLNIDGHRAQYRASEILVSNGAFLKEAPFPLGPREKFSDGEFDVYILTAQNLRDYLALLLNLVFNREARKKELRMLTAKEKVTIEGIGRQYTVQADGELIGHTPVEVHVAHHAIRVIAPHMNGNAAS